MDLNSIEWLLSRGAGFAAFALLTATVAFGLALSLRWTSAMWPSVVTNEVHRSLTGLALWMTGIHLATLLVDAESGFGLVDLLVPFAAGYRPVATTLGILALFATVSVIATTALRGRLGYRRWRQLHGLAFVAYTAALFHGVFSGTDTGTPWATFAYLASATLVGGLIVVRVLPAPRRAAPGTAAVQVAGRPSGESPLPPLAPRSAGEARPGLPPLGS